MERSNRCLVTHHQTSHTNADQHHPQGGLEQRDVTERDANLNTPYIFSVQKTRPRAHTPRTKERAFQNGVSAQRTRAPGNYMQYFPFTKYLPSIHHLSMQCTRSFFLSGISADDIGLLSFHPTLFSNLGERQRATAPTAPHRHRSMKNSFPTSCEESYASKDDFPPTHQPVKTNKTTQKPQQDSKTSLTPLPPLLFCNPNPSNNKL